MTLMRWDPWGDLAVLQRGLWEQAFGRRAGTDMLVVPTDVFRTDSGVSLRMELPGMDPQDVEITIADGRLTVSGERRTEEKAEEGNWVRRERSVGRFQRTFTLPEGIDPEKVTASFEHGVLQLEIPHAPERQVRKIAVGTTLTDGQQS